MATHENGDRPTHQPRGPIPTPVVAAIGAIATGVRGVRRLPENAVRVPVLGIGYALQAAEAARREYAEYVARGVRVLQLLRRGASRESAPDLLRRTGGDDVEREAREVSRRAAAAVRKATEVRRRTPPVRAVPEPAREQRPSPAAQEAGAPGVATEVAEQAAERIAEQEPTGATEPPSADELPIADFDHVTVASLRARLRSLDVAQLVRLREYEQAHAHRLQVVTMLENRIARLQQEQPGSGRAGAPEADHPGP